MEVQKEETLSINQETFQKSPMQLASEPIRRHIAYKFRIGTILSGKPILENERLRFIEINNKNIVRVNIIANIIDKFIQEGEKKFASITLDDATGQIRVRAFGDDIIKFSNFNQGDTVMVIGLLRYWNNEIYMTPELIKIKDPSFLLVRKLEVEALEPKVIDKQKLLALKDKILQMVKEAENVNGIEVEKIILELKENPATINNEIKKLVLDGHVYEPRPGKLRYLG